MPDSFQNRLSRGILASHSQFVPLRDAAISGLSLVASPAAPAQRPRPLPASISPRELVDTLG